jgi:hypothetical protein
VDASGWCFEVVALEGRRIERVLATPLTQRDQRNQRDETSDGVDG